jgi:hypothetical protein
MGDEESDLDSCDGVIQSLSQLKIEENSSSPETMSDASGEKPTSDENVSDVTFLSPRTASIGSTNTGEEVLICHHNKPFEKLNDFIFFSNILPFKDDGCAGMT